MKREKLALGPPMAAVVLAAVLAVTALVLATTLASPARAATTFTVNQTTDATDVDTTDDTCDSDAGTPGDQCTLRAAIQEANDPNGATAGEDTIDFSVDTVTLSITGQGEDAAATGDLDITEDLTIDGGGVVIDADGIDRVFHVVGPAGATISEVTVQGGEESNGGGIFVDANATLDLSGSTLRKNEAFDNGGGIFVETGGTANIATSTFDGNTAETDGGGIVSFGALSVERSTFTKNVADFNRGGAGFGGGLSVSDGTATVTNSTISSNTTFGTPFDSGGGVAVMRGTLSLTNVTIANNRAPRSFGGGISNTTGDDANVQARNTIVANNTQLENGQCGAVDPNTGDPVSGGVTSQGGNLEFPGDSCGFEVQGDPSLGPLAGYGGPTQTRVLSPGSAAIDAATDCPPPAADQRGVTRPQDGDGDGTAACDIGAFESDPADLSITDARKTEGDGGLSEIVFTVTLSEERIGPVKVDYSTSGGTATPRDDYISESGTLTFAPGETSKEIRILVVGDTREEANESFAVNLSNVVGEVIVQDSRGVGTIVNDDGNEPPPPPPPPGENCTKIGTEGNDNLNGTPGYDVICARGGNDTVRGGRDPDVLLGEKGNDTLRGGENNDRLDGGPGKDRLFGEGGDQDEIVANDGTADLVDCGPGDSDLAKVDPKDTVRNCETVRQT